MLDGQMNGDAPVGVPIAAYWSRTLRESLIKDPFLPAQVEVDLDDILSGALPAPAVQALYTAWLRIRPKEDGGDERLPLRLLVSPYLVGPVTGGARTQDGEPFPPFWVPAIMRPDGILIADPENLPFIPRALLDPPMATSPSRLPDAVADVDGYEEAVRDMEVDREEGWTARLTHAERMFEEVAGLSPSLWLPEGWQRMRPIVALWEKERGAAALLLPLTDALDGSKPLPGCLGAVVAQKTTCTLPSDDMTPKQLGHVGSNALNHRQRDCVHAVSALEPGAVQAVNGPPGTGKTSLLKTLIADAVVRAAVTDAPAPIILLTSTNNQAVRNAAIDIAVETSEQMPIARRRWMPGVPGLVAYAVSREGSREAAGVMLLEPLLGRIFADSYLDEATGYFLQHYATWRDEDPLPAERTSLEKAIAELKAALRQTVGRIEDIGDMIQKATAYQRDGGLKRQALEAAENKIDQAKRAAAELELASGGLDFDVKEIARLRHNRINLLRGRAALHPLWLRLLSVFSPFEAGRANLLRDDAISLGFLPSDVPFFRTRVEVYAEVYAAFTAQVAEPQRQVDELRSRLENCQRTVQENKVLIEELRSTINSGLAADQALREWVQETDDPGAADYLDAAQRKLDLLERSTAFDLAMRLREAEFLHRAGEWDKAWATGRGKSKDKRPLLLRALALLVPGVVATVYKTASHCCYFDGRSNRPLEEIADLLIFDEAGQVLPDHGLPLLALAKRAVAVGDIHQIEPIAAFGEAADTRLMEAAGVLPGGRDLLRRRGLCHSTGSVMRAFQSGTAYSDPGQPPGILLRHHFRCVPALISYCDDLVYGNKLIKCRAAVAMPSIPPMAWGHVRGLARRAGTSWTNVPEAEAIGRWLAGRKAAIEAEHGARLADLVAVITPYAKQSQILRAALKENLGAAADGMTVGTVHTLQGAQRRIILFSPTVTIAGSPGITPFFDRGPNMLNVAVSRAQDAFVVIGDMSLFDAREDSGRKPSAVLARRLFADQGNELLDVLPTLQAAQPERSFERLDGVAAHRALLAAVFSTARKRILIASPFLTRAAIEADNVVGLVKAATARQVEVLVYTGMRTGLDETGTEAERLQQQLSAAGALVRDTGRVHAKTLIADDALIAEGSFNWLSASRDPRWANKESSVVLRGADAAEAVAQAMKEFKALDAGAKMVESSVLA